MKRVYDDVDLIKRFVTLHNIKVGHEDIDEDTHDNMLNLSDDTPVEHIQIEGGDSTKSDNKMKDNENTPSSKGVGRNKDCEDITPSRKGVENTKDSDKTPSSKVIGKRMDNKKTPKSKGVGKRTTDSVGSDFGKPDVGEGSINKPMPVSKRIKTSKV